MDDRQRQITEGAGLQESRLNTDFIDWLQRWGTPILLVVCVIAIAYSGRTWWQRTQAVKLDEAYVQLNAAMIAGSPDGLLRVAREHRSSGAVAIMATLAAADAYLATGVTGVVPGGDPNAEDDRLNDDEIRANLLRAGELYNDVVRMVGSDKRKALHALQARIGSAAAAVGLNDVEGANRILSETATLARASGFPGLAETAEARMEMIRSIDLVARLPEREDIAPSARPRDESDDDFSNIQPMFSPGSDIFGPAGPDDAALMELLRQQQQQTPPEPTEPPATPDDEQ